jgi:DNA-binding GntR family transcriptional regulator
MAAAVDKAYLEIRDGIVRGRYLPGTHLTAEDLAKNSGLSRTPVREAMRRLHAEGLIVFIPYRGAFVARIEENEIRNIYDLRVVLESYAAEAAAKRRTPEQLDKLRALAERMHSLVAHDASAHLEEIAEINNDFHKLVVAASHNSRLATALSAVMEVPLALRTFQRYDRSELQRSANQHLEIISALDAGDAAWARSIMTSHILSAANTLLKAMQGAAEEIEPDTDVRGAAETVG